MRVTKYNLLLNEDKLPYLVKEATNNYSEITQLNSPEKIRDMFNTVYHASVLSEEYMWMLALNTKNHPIGIFELSHGTVNFSFVGIREIMIRLCMCGAVNFVIVHNHPSGCTEPSKEDMSITKSIKEASDLMRFNFLDHIIIGDDYYSFRENNKL